MSALFRRRRFSRMSPRNRPGSSGLTVAAVMIAIGAVLVASIASVFIYSNGSTLTQTAYAPLPPPAVYEKSAPETTGSGQAN
jgi:hypothetical protein